MRRQQLVHAPEQRLLAERVLQCQIVIESLIIYFRTQIGACKQRFDL